MILAPFTNTCCRQDAKSRVYSQRRDAASEIERGDWTHHRGSYKRKARAFASPGNLLRDVLSYYLPVC